MTISTSTLAATLDIGPADALDAARKAGATEFHWEGRTYDYAGIESALARFWHWDATGEVDIEMTDEQYAALQAEWPEAFAQPTGA